MPKLERDYQAQVIKKIEKLLPGCFVLKNDANYRQGIPDWTIFYGPNWAVLEIKRKRPTNERDFQPNQEWYLEALGEMSFTACLFPENEREVLRDLQSALRA